MESHSAYSSPIAVAVLAGAAMIFLGASESTVRAQSVGPSGCVKNCPGRSTGGSGKSTGGSSTPTGPTAEEIEKQEQEIEFRRLEAAGRRNEKARKAREASEDEHYRLEEERRHKEEFEKNKKSVLKQINPDFDGSGNILKSLPGMGQTVTGVVGGPQDAGKGTALKSLPGRRPIFTGPRYTKGSKDSAPVDLTDLDPARPFDMGPGRLNGLVPNGDIATLIEQKPWSTGIKMKAAAGLTQLARSRHEDAIALLEAASSAAPNDAFLRRAVAHAKAEKTKANKDLQPSLGIINRKVWLAALPDEARAAYLVGNAQLEIGDRATAMRMFERASRAAPDDRDLRWYAHEVRKLHLETDRPSAQKRQARAAQVRRAEKWAQYHATVRMGLAFAWRNGGQNRKKAVKYFREAKAIGGRKDPWIDQAIRDVQKGQEVFLLSPDQLLRTQHSIPNPFPTRAHLVIDALQYGKGNWDTATRYLLDARSLLPNNPVVGPALAELAAVRELEKPPRVNR